MNVSGRDVASFRERHCGEGMATTEGPDFICVGMPKAGTGWLYDQLKHHPDFWLPPVKELNYLNNSRPALTNIKRSYKLGQAKANRLRKRAHRPKWDDRDFAFLEDAFALAKHERDIARYATVFRHK